MIEILMIMLFGLFYGKFLLLEYFLNRPKAG